MISVRKEQDGDVLTVDDCNIHVPEDTDGLLDGHHEWPAQVDFHQVNKAKSLIVARPVPFLAGLLSPPFGSDLE